MTSQTFFDKEGVYVGMPERFSDDTKQDVFDYIAKNHYRGIPTQDDGSVNPYQYCYGLGYVVDSFQMFGAMISGYPTQAFQQQAPHIVDELGNSWISENVANIYRIVAHYQEHADELLRQYEKAAVRRGIKILYSLPTKQEKDAVCNFNWFERNGFNCYGKTENEGARFYMKKIADMPTLPPAHGFNKIVKS